MKIGPSRVQNMSIVFLPPFQEKGEFPGNEEYATSTRKSRRVSQRPCLLCILRSHSHEDCLFFIINHEFTNQSNRAKKLNRKRNVGIILCENGIILLRSSCSILSDIKYVHYRVPCGIFLCTGQTLRLIILAR